jgi:hypothetical protein
MKPPPPAKQPPMKPPPPPQQPPMKPPPPAKQQPPSDDPIAIALARSLRSFDEETKLPSGDPMEFAVALSKASFAQERQPPTGSSDLAERGLRLVHNTGQGNCCPLSIMCAVEDADGGRTAMDAVGLRAAVADDMNKHPAVYRLKCAANFPRQYVPTNDELDGVVRARAAKVTVLGEWFDAVEIFAAARVLNRTITVIEETHGFMSVNKPRLPSTAGTNIYIVRLDQMHYEAALPIP